MRTLAAIAGSVLFAVVWCHAGESPPAEAEATPGYVVILKDGQRIPARAKPISAFGKFRYQAEDGRTRVVPVGRVDLEATRRANRSVVPAKPGGTLSVAGGVSSGGGESSASGSVAASAAGQAEAVDTAKKTKKKATVVVYSATWCGYCVKLKRFLASKGISATIYEVDTLPQTEQTRHLSRMKQLTGRVAYPTVVINGRAKAGYSPSWINAQLGL